MSPDVSSEIIGAARVKEIEWSHPRLENLSDAARFLYACLVDGVSEQALDTIAGVEMLWRNRDRYRASERPQQRRAALETICTAVDELIAGGLLVLLDESTLSGGWVQKPWQGLPA